MTEGSRRIWANVAALALIVAVGVIAYLPIRHNGFIDIDDPIYITVNPHVSNGLTSVAARWAFTTDYAANWHPLTWLSLMLDVSLWGVNAPRIHETNVALHIADACLVFVLIRLLGGSALRSGIVGLIFAVHPSHVESVAWAAERKDVLAALFGLLSLCCYIRSARSRNPNRAVWYALTFLTFALGLLAKPTVVTLPFVYLLLDYWPLNRLFVSAPHSARKNAPLMVRVQWRVLLEKIPFFLLCIGSSVMTFLAQRQGGAVASVTKWPIQMRLANAIVSYLRYLGIMFWPVHLGPFYPLNDKDLPDWWVILAIGTVLIVTIFTLLRRKSRPYLLVGWLWFLGMLVPEIGLIQVGGQSIADRYLYLPSIGLLIAIAWLLGDWFKQSFARIVLLIGSAGAIAACTILTFHQVEFWKDTPLLMHHTLAVVEDNAFCHFFLGADAAQASHADEAIAEFNRAIELQPGYGPPYVGLGRMLMFTGRFDEARQWYAKAVQVSPTDAWVYWNIGDLDGLQGNWKAAAAEYEHSLQLQPDEPIVIENLAMSYIQLGRLAEAQSLLERFLQMEPNDLAHHYLLATIYDRNHDLASADRELSLVAQNAPSQSAPQVQWQLAMLELRRGKILEAVPHLRSAAQLNPNLAPAMQNLAWILATYPDPKQRDAAQALQLAERANDLSKHNVPEMLDTLAAAYAANGQFPKAIQTAHQAISAAKNAGRSSLVTDFTERLNLYQVGKPFVDESLASKN